MLKKFILIPTKFYITILIKYNELLSNNYIFKLVSEYLVVLFTILINLSFYAVLIYNDIN